MRQSRGLLLLLAIIIVIVVSIAAKPETQLFPSPSVRNLSGDSLTTTPSLPAPLETLSPSPFLPQAQASALLPTAVASHIGPTLPSSFASDIQGITPEGTATTGVTPFPDWNPPPQEVPIARHPNDHYWLIRPVGSDNRNFGLPQYAYGSDGPADDLRTHHGIDIANPIGVEVFSAADGIAVWSGKGHYNREVGEGISSYGETVVIRHDFGYKGRPVFTLYAHLSARLIDAGQRVESGDVIALIGNTGQVTGPHVHFEVRVGSNSYFAVQNPELWMAPYVETGVIAGRIEGADQRPLTDAPITVIHLKTNRVEFRTTTYAGSGINADENWQENFVIPDVPAGRYLVTGRYNNDTWSAEITVVPGITNWVDMVLTQDGLPFPTENAPAQEDDD